MQTQQVVVDAPVGKVQEEATTSRGKKSKPDADIDMFLDTEIKMEVDEDGDYNINPIKSTVKNKQKSSIKKGAKGKNRGINLHLCLNTLGETPLGLSTNSG